MNSAERDAFAQDVANQNRALATLGGVAGLAGLKGVVADMAWLLMVSLRTVYQVAAIYDKPLTGKEGVKKSLWRAIGCKFGKITRKTSDFDCIGAGQHHVGQRSKHGRQSAARQSVSALS